jgi:hypothetical protein
MDVERLAAAWAEVEAARTSKREPDWSRVPGLTIEDRLVVLELDVVVAAARVEGARGWEGQVRVEAVESLWGRMYELWERQGWPGWVDEAPDDVLVAAFALCLSERRAVHRGSAGGLQ